jgi:hypothetical protein
LIEIANGRCRNCNIDSVKLERNTANHFLHFILTIFTMGLWGIIWVLIAIGGGQWHCSQCGSTQVSRPLFSRGFGKLLVVILLCSFALFLSQLIDPDGAARSSISSKRKSEYAKLRSAREEARKERRREAAESQEASVRSADRVDNAKEYSYEIVNEKIHDTRAKTQIEVDVVVSGNNDSEALRSALSELYTIYSKKRLFRYDTRWSNNGRASHIFISLYLSKSHIIGKYPLPSYRARLIKTPVQDIEIILWDEFFEDAGISWYENVGEAKPEGEGSKRKVDGPIPNDPFEATEMLLSLDMENVSKDYIRVLINEGADANAKNNDGWTPLMFAARYSSSPEIVKLLIEKGADVNARDNNGAPLLIYAVRQTPEIVKLLVDNGADVNVKSRGGFTPLNLAESDGNKWGAEIIRILKAAGAKE